MSSNLTASAIHMTPRLSLRDISKRYSSVVANDAISFDVQAGEILAVLGENGAGKSTLMKVVYGAIRPDGGTIAVDGSIVYIDSPRRARALGIAMVFQHFALFDSLTVLENIALAWPAMTLQTVRARTLELAACYGIQIDPAQRVHDLSAGERQRVEIVRALLQPPRILILDEPTSVLPPPAIDRLFETLRQLAADGVAVIFVSHKLHEIRRLATRCLILRAGRLVATVDPRHHSEASLANLMLGADLPDRAAMAESQAGSVALSVMHLSMAEPYDRLHDVSFDVRSGEIVGLAGIAGNGQSALLATLAGELPGKAGAVRLFDQPVGDLGPAERRRLGLRYVPDQRLGHAAVAEMTLAQNAVLTGESLQTGGFIQFDAAADFAHRVARRFDVRGGGPAARSDTLSGGNLQKYIVGRELMHAPRVLLMHQPTWGVDAGAAAAIRNELLALRAQGCAILLASEELDELLHLADRLLVISAGKVSPPLPARAADIAEIGRWMAGRWPTDAAQAVPEAA